VSSRSSDSPWLAADVTRLASLLAVALIAHTVAWYGSSGTTSWSTQMAWMVLSIAAVTVAAASCARWVITGMRSTRWERAQIVRVINAVWPDKSGGDRTTAVEERYGAPVAAPTMTRFHRPSCQLAAGKDVTGLTEAQIVDHHLAPCEMCAP
jgi:hypothetical protein